MSAPLVLTPELLDAARVSPAWPFEEARKTFERDYLVAQIGLTDSKTPAMIYGRYLDYVNLGLLGLALAWMLVRKILERRNPRA